MYRMLTPRRALMPSSQVAYLLCVMPFLPPIHFEPKFRVLFRLHEFQIFAFQILLDFAIFWQNHYRFALFSEVQKRFPNDFGLMCQKF